MAQAAGEPRALSYFVELKNHRGRSAGQSNAAVVLAGEAPAPVTGLAAKVSKAGVTLRWTAAQEQEPSAIRLHRKLLTPPAAKPAQGLLAPQPETLEQNLLVAAEGRAPDRALDKEIRFGQVMSTGRSAWPASLWTARRWSCRTTVCAGSRGGDGRVSARSAHWAGAVANRGRRQQQGID